MQYIFVPRGYILTQYAGLFIAYLLWLRYYRPPAQICQARSRFHRKAMSSFFLIYYTLHDSLQNHALWIGFLVYLALRIIVQALLIARKDIG